MPFFILILMLAGVPAKAVTISEIPAMVRSRNGEVLAAERDAEAAGHSRWAAKARYLPTLGVTNTYIHLGNDIQIQIPAQTITGSLGSLSFTPPPVTIQAKDAFFSTLILKMPLYAGGRITAGSTAADAKWDEAKIEHSKVTDEKVEEALTRYFSVQLAREIIEALTKIKADLDRIQAISEGLTKTGLSPKFATLQIKVAQAELTSKLSEAKGKADLADLAFKSTTGKKSLEGITYETPLQKLSMPSRVDTYKTEALKKRKEFAIIQSKEEQVGALKSFHTGEMLPTLFAVGSRQLYSQNLPLLEPSWAVGVVLEIPLTGWLSGLPERNAAIELEKKVEITKARAMDEIPLQIEKIYSELQAADGSYNAAMEGTGMAKEALRLAEIRFKTGSGSALELLKTSAELEKMEILRLKALEEFNRKLIELYQASGDVNLYIAEYSHNIPAKEIKK